MVQYQVKLKLNSEQEAKLVEWLPILTSVWNWAIRKIELDAKDKIYHSEFDLNRLLKNHSKRLGVPSHTLRGMVDNASASWQRCFSRITKRPKLKGNRNRLNSIPFPDPLVLENNSVRIAGLGKVKFHKMELPNGKVKCGRIVKRASGWYLCLFIDAELRRISAVRTGSIGIDPGFKSLLVTSDGEVINHPRELEQTAVRLAQAQRGSNKKLVARIHERIKNQRKNRNHNLSRQLVAENKFIAFSADQHRGIAKKFGKSVTSSAHYQLRQMLSYKSKCRTDGLGVYVEVDSRYSTMTCSNCGARTGPTGWAGLKVRQWQCSECGVLHDRDVNAARNVLLAGAGCAHEKMLTASV